MSAPAVVVVALNYPDAEQALADLEVPRREALILSSSIADDQVRDCSIDPATNQLDLPAGVHAGTVALDGTISPWSAALPVKENA